MTKKVGLLRRLSRRLSRQVDEVPDAVSAAPSGASSSSSGDDDVGVGACALCASAFTRKKKGRRRVCGGCGLGFCASCLRFATPPPTPPPTPHDDPVGAMGVCMPGVAVCKVCWLQDTLRFQAQLGEHLSRLAVTKRRASIVPLSEAAAAAAASAAAATVPRPQSPPSASAPPSSSAAPSPRPPSTACACVCHEHMALFGIAVTEDGCCPCAGTELLHRTVPPDTSALLDDVLTMEAADALFDDATARHSASLSSSDDDATDDAAAAVPTPPPLARPPPAPSSSLRFLWISLTLFDPPPYMRSPVYILVSRSLPNAPAVFEPVGLTEAVVPSQTTVFRILVPLLLSATRDERAQTKIRLDLREGSPTSASLTLVTSDDRGAPGSSEPSTGVPPDARSPHLRPRSRASSLVPGAAARAPGRKRGASLSSRSDAGRSDDAVGWVALPGSALEPEVGASVSRPMRAPGSTTPLGHLVVTTEAVSTPSSRSVAQRRYRIATDAGGAVATETLTPSPLAFSVPRKLLLVYVERRMAELNALTRRFASEHMGVDESADVDPAELLLVRKINRLRVYLSSVLATGLAVCLASSVGGSMFKTSNDKADDAARFVATNLYIHRLAVADRASTAPPVVYATVTSGAPAAHVYKFRNGGLRQLHQALADAATAPTVDPAAIDAIEWEISIRFELVLCHILSMLATSVTVEGRNAVMSGDYARLDSWVAHGYLFQVESLLSTRGRELGMLGDMDVAVRALTKIDVVVRFARVALVGTTHASSFDTLELLPHHDSSSRYTLALTLALGSDAVFDPIPDAWKSGVELAVVPLLVTQGINEQQSLANFGAAHSSLRFIFGSTELQSRINDEALLAVQAYTSRLHTRPPELDELEECLSADDPATKNTLVLQVTSALTRAVGGARATCCKSAKDRTAMSVTLEHAYLLARNHAMTDDVADLAAVMRAFGVRKDNVKLNTGKSGYAFNRLQRAMLPPDYKPP